MIDSYPNWDYRNEKVQGGSSQSRLAETRRLFLRLISAAGGQQNTVRVPPKAVNPADKKGKRLGDRRLSEAPHRSEAQRAPPAKVIMLHQAADDKGRRASPERDSNLLCW